MKPVVSKKEQTQINRTITLSAIERVRNALAGPQTNPDPPMKFDYYTPSTDNRDETTSASPVSSSGVRELIPMSAQTSQFTNMGASQMGCWTVVVMRGFPSFLCVVGMITVVLTARARGNTMVRVSGESALGKTWSSLPRAFPEALLYIHCQIRELGETR